MSGNRWSAWIRYGLPGLLAGLALAGAVNGQRAPQAQAQNQPGSPADGNGTIAFTTQTQQNAQLLYVIDTRSQSFAVYRVDPNDHKGTLKLEATRQFRWDLKLGEFNNQPPEVGAVQAMVGSVQR
jgi:hypothetical protein